jgi:hypothetical protein
VINGKNIRAKTSMEALSETTVGEETRLEDGGCSEDGNEAVTA